MNFKRPPRMKRFLLQVPEATLKAIRAEARKRGAPSQAETIRTLIADGFAFRKWVESRDVEQSPPSAN